MDVLATGREADIRDMASLEAASRGHAPRCVINAAACTAVDRAEVEPDEAFATNAQGAGLVADLAANIGADLVHLSSDYVLSGAPPEAIGEDAAPAPLGVYARSKLEGERRVLATVDDRRRVIVLRTSWVFGLHGASFVSRMLELLAERDELDVVDDQFGRPTAATDLVEATLALAGLTPGVARAASGIYHFANAGATSWHGFAAAIRDAALRHGRPVRARVVNPVPTSAFPRPAPRPSWSVLDTTKLERTLGRAPRSWQDALESYFAA